MRSPIAFAVRCLGGASLVALMVSAVDRTEGRPQPAATSVSFPAPPAPPFQLRVRAEGPPLPAGCDPREAAGIVTGFVAAFNRGDQGALARFFSSEAAGEGAAPKLGQFGWHGVTGRPEGSDPGFVAFSREALLPLLAARHARHERLRLLQLEVAGSWHGGVDMVFDVERRADDVPTHVAGGKGALDCEGRTVMVWSLGDREVLTDFVSPPPTPTCPAVRPKCE